MLSDFVDCSVVDHQSRLLDQRQSVRLARCVPARPLNVRLADARTNLGFRLIEVGLRLAVGHVEPTLTSPRSSR